MNVHVPAFRVQRVVIIQMQAYDQDRSLDLYAKFGKHPVRLYDAIEAEDIVPLDENHRWYLGPSHKIFWHRGIFLLHEVQEMIASNKNFSYIGNNRREEIVSYLHNLH